MAGVLRHRSGILTHGLVRVLAAAALIAALPAAAAPAFLDAVLADVNGTVVTVSDVAIARALGLFGLMPSAAPILDQDVRRMADAWLLADEARRLQIVPDSADIEEAWRAAADRLGGIHILQQWLDETELDAGWVRTLVEADVRRRRFIEVRFRAFVFVTEDELTRALGQGSHSLDAREKTRNALREAGVARELAAWLTDARKRATIRQAEVPPAGAPLPFPMSRGVAP